MVRQEGIASRVIEKTIGIADPKSRPARTHCPFHSDDSPSLYVYPERWRCFVCNIGGDSIDFIKRWLGVGFPESVDYIFHEILGYGRSTKPKDLAYSPMPFGPTVIGKVKDYPSVEERIKACEKILPKDVLPYFLAAERLGPELLHHLSLEVKFLPEYRSMSAIEFITYWHRLPPENTIEALVIWEEWCLRASAYFTTFIMWERIKKELCPPSIKSSE